MRPIQRLTVAFLAFLVSLPVVAAQRISGVVFAEGKADKVTIRVWALGEPLLAKPALADTPLAAAAVTPGSAFTFDLPDGALPVRVEASASGHIGAAFTVALPEQSALPALWLPSGTELKLRVLADGKPAAGSRVTGQILFRRGSVELNGWQPVVPTTEADAKGEAKVWLPEEGALVLSGRGRDGRWGVLSARRPAPASAVLQLDSRPVAVVVRDQRGEPIRGARGSAANAPNTPAVTNDQGRALVQVAGKGDVEIVAIAPGVLGRIVRHAPPAGEVVLAVEPLRDLEVQWTGSQRPVLLEPEWLPNALRGGSPIVGRGGKVQIPFVAGGGTLTVWSPGTAAQQLTVRSAEQALAVPLAAGARVEGLVVEAADVPAAGVPVWCAQGMRWPGLPRRFARDASRLERPILPMAVTGSGGGFTLSDLSAGALRLTARKVGLPPADSGPLDATAGASQRVTLRLEKGTWLALQLRDPDGRPLGGVSVSAYRDEDRRRRGASIRMMFGPVLRRDEPLASSTSDREGAMRLQAVPSGDLILDLELAGYVSRRLEVTLPAEGKDLGPQVLDPAVTVLGRVVDETGRGVADVDVFATASPSGGLPFGLAATRSDALGNFGIPDQPRQGDLFLEARSEQVFSLQPTKVALPPAGVVEVKVRQARVLEGRVVDEQTTEPVRGAAVRATKNVLRTFGGGQMVMQTGVSLLPGETDDTGTFRLEGLQVGEYSIVVMAPGYKQATVETTVPEEGPAKSVTVVLKRGLVLRGRVVDGQDAPAPGVEVTAQPASSQFRSGVLSTRENQARSGPDGRFVIEGLDAGRYQVVAEDDSGAQGRDIADAGRDQEVVLRLESPGAISGRVTFGDGAPVAAARVTALMSTAGAVMPSDKTADAGGSFTFDGLAPGRYIVRAQAEGLAPGSQSVTVETGRTAPVELVLKRGGTVLGRVLGLSADELKGCQISGGGASAQPSPDGSFRVDGVRVGVSDVTAFVLPQGKQRTAKVEIKDLDTPATVELDFSSGISLRGSVRRGGRPAAGLMVQAQTRGQRAGSSTLTDEGGEWEIKGLDPGEIDVSAMDDQGRTLATQHVKATGDTRVELVVPGGSLAGRVTDAVTREPVSEAQVRATLQGDVPQARRATTDQIGSFALRELADGSYTIKVEAPGYAPGEAQASLSMGRAQDVAVALQPEQRLTLLVRDVDGGVLDQVYVYPMRNGRVEDLAWAQCDREGRAVFTTLAPGVYTLRIGGGKGVAIIAATVPGQASVQLVPAGALAIAPPAGTAPSGWKVRVVVGGLVFPMYSSQNPSRGEWAELPAVGMRLQVPAGPCTVQTIGPDGVTYDQQAVVPAQGQVTVRPEGP